MAIPKYGNQTDIYDMDTAYTRCSRCGHLVAVKDIYREEDSPDLVLDYKCVDEPRYVPPKYFDDEGAPAFVRIHPQDLSDEEVE